MDTESSFLSHFTFWLIWLGPLLLVASCIGVISRNPNRVILITGCSVFLTAALSWCLTIAHWILSGRADDQPMTILGAVFVAPFMAIAHSLILWFGAGVVWFVRDLWRIFGPDKASS